MLSINFFYKSMFTVYITILAIAVFIPRPDFQQTTSSIAVFQDSSPEVNLLRDFLYDASYLKSSANIVMLTPLAVLIPKISLVQSKQTLVLITITFSTFIEFIQIYIPGRVSDVRDIVLNTLGVMILLVLKNRNHE
jgi:glycopeptide antibiotics resistance protein